MRRLTRRRLLAVGLGAAASLAAAPKAALAGKVRAPLLRGITVRNLGRRYVGDRRLFATLSPGVSGQGTVSVSFGLNRRAMVLLEAVRIQRQRPIVAWRSEQELDAGKNELTWTPAADTPVGSYVLRLTLEDGQGARRVYGGSRPLDPNRSRAPVARVLNVEASFDRRSYLPGEPMRMRLLADTPTLTLTFLRCGHEPVATGRNDEFSGVEMGEPVSIDWAGKRSTPTTIEIQSGHWPTGLYAVRLETPDGRLGFAPFILRPEVLGTHRQAAILPTNTWQAYNYYDANGDGWGDSWYAGGNPPVLLDRPYLHRGVPPRYRRYDLPFLRWLRRMNRTPDILAEDDLEAFPSGDDLRRLYDLVVFPGHTEYVTESTFDVIERFRDLGGRLIFLSANNFFWKVNKAGNEIRRAALWRDIGRPEASLLGAQYRANDDGTRQAPFTVAGAAVTPWLFEKTGLVNGSTFGETVGGYGIEIDATTENSPPGTHILARADNIFGPTLNAEMTYYETPAGARVFNAGVLDFCSSVMTWPVWKLCDNLWRHMLTNVPAPPPPPEDQAA